MGSNPSKSVVMDIRIPTNEAEKDPKDIYKTPQNYEENKDGLSDFQGKLKDKDVVAILLRVREELRQSKQKTARAEEEISVLQQQLKERDDDISSLQTEIQICDDRAVEKEQTPAMERTLQAKDQYIHRLEAEVQQLRQESTQVSEKYARKLHKVRALSSKSRQDSQLKVFELKDTNAKLKEENTKLKERLDRTSVGSASSSRDIGDEESSDPESPAEDSRTKLILELSQQVAELDQENSRLKRDLRHSRKIAEKIERSRSSGTIPSESLCLRTSVADTSLACIKSS